MPTDNPTPADPPDTVEFVDAMSAEAEPLAEYPPGTPEFLGYLNLKPRSRRSKFKRRYAELGRQEDTLNEARRRAAALEASPGQSMSASANMLDLSADLDDLYGIVDEVLEIAAVDPAAYREWSDNLADDNDLVRVFQLYATRSQPGEASSSAT